MRSVEVETKPDPIGKRSVIHDPSRFRPWGHRLLLKMDPFEKELKQTKGGVWLPPTQLGRRPKWRSGVIEARGNGRFERVVVKRIYQKETGKTVPVYETLSNRIPLDPELAIGVRVLVGFYIGDLIGNLFGGRLDDYKIVSDDQIEGFIEVPVVGDSVW